jgi:2,3-bisphosphoglycerate-dependent phosphoglycerate mutase
MTTLYFVRHAESPFVFNKERERPISESGHEKSKVIAELLAHESIDYIFSSAYKRAIQTVEYLAREKKLMIHEYEEINERLIKGMDYKMEWHLLEEAIEKSFTNMDYALEGGETTRSAQERSIPLIHNLLEVYEGKTMVMATHGNIMTIILKYFNDDYGYDFWKTSSKPDIYKLTFEKKDLMSVERKWQKS